MPRIVALMALALLLDVERVGDDLADGEHAEDDRQAVEAALERRDAEGQPHDARALVDARIRDQHAEQAGREALEERALPTATRSGSAPSR